MQRANELREVIANAPVVSGEVARSITMSMGIAVSQCIGVKEVETLLKRADGALYAAKEKGRNRVEYLDAVPKKLAARPRKG
jgi:diguanylate cyclase (GGDEF)-like protein